MKKKTIKYFLLLITTIIAFNIIVFFHNRALEEPLNILPGYLLLSTAVLFGAALELYRQKNKTINVKRGHLIFSIVVLIINYIEIAFWDKYGLTTKPVLKILVQPLMYLEVKVLLATITGSFLVQSIIHNDKD